MPTGIHTNNQLIDSEKASAPLRWLEVLVVTAFVVVLCAWNRPDDPFYLNQSFPWPVLAPLLVGLRYGFFMALASCLLILAALGWYLQAPEQPGLPWAWVIGLLGTGLVAGEFRDFWGRRLEKLEAVNRYRSQRLDEFTRNYYLLKVSHDRLEQQVAGSSGSLREALRRLYREVDLAGDSGLNRESAELMLQLLVRYGQLQSAAIYAVSKDRLDGRPLATTGDYQPIHENDPLIQHALEQRTLVSVQTQFRDHLANLDTDLLLVIPFIDSAGNLVAICAVQAIPFFSFQVKTLRLLAILSGHMADMTLQQQTTQQHETREWRTLYFQLRRVGRDAEEFSLPATLLAFDTEAGYASILEARMRRMRRGLDIIASEPLLDRQLIVLLMPLTDELGAAGYLQRLDDDLQQSTGHPLSDTAIRHSHSIRSQAEAETWLTRLRDTGDVSE